MTGHTPGPWVLQIDDSGAPIIRSQPTAVTGFPAKSSWNIALISGGRPGFDEAEANAHLMVASPEMKTALQAARVVVEAEGANATLAIIDLALAKAEGRNE